MVCTAAFIAFVAFSLTSAAQAGAKNLDSDCAAHGSTEEASLLAKHMKVHRGLSATQAGEAASSASALASVVTTTNVCQPDNGCNVCTDCCQSYITDGPNCDSCVAAQCSTTIVTTSTETTTTTTTTTTTPPVANVCQPENDCNVCTACCQSYITNGPNCDSCVAAQCSSSTTTTTTSTEIATTSTTTSSLAVSCSDLKDRCTHSISNWGVQYGGCPKFANNFATSCYSKYHWPSQDYDECTSVIAMVYKDCLDTTLHPYYRDDCKSDVCHEIEPNPNKDDSDYCQNIEKVCESSFYYGPVPYGMCPNWLAGFQSTCVRKLGGSQCSWQGELVSQQSTGCFNVVERPGYSQSDCIKAAGC